MRFDLNNFDDAPEDFLFTVSKVISICRSSFQVFKENLNKLLDDEDFQKLAIWTADKGRLIQVKEPEPDGTAWYIGKTITADNQANIKNLSLSEQLEMQASYDFATEHHFDYQGNDYICRFVWAVCRTTEGIKTCPLAQYVIDEDNNSIDLMEWRTKQTV